MKKRIILTAVVFLTAFMVPKLADAKWLSSLEGEAVYDTEASIDLEVFNIKLVGIASVKSNLLGYYYDCKFEWFSSCDTSEQGFKPI